VNGSIKDWPAGERPREKMLHGGANVLSDAELLALVLRTGGEGRTALDLARGLMGGEKTLRDIGAMTAGELMRVRGIGAAKAAELLAAFEIGRRAQAMRSPASAVIRTPEDVAHRMIPMLRDRPIEVFTLLVLDAKNAVKCDLELSAGTLNASLVHPREVFKAAIDRMAASVIVVHNHPSGNPEPSREDIDVTRQLAEAGRIVGIPLYDHIIVAGDRYTSLAERGLLP
jgi:DNA repair protein RadC